MKFMKLGTRPDTFYTEEATRTVISDVPSDLTIRINNITFLLHKQQYPLLPKCGLLRRLYSESDDSSDDVTLKLDDIPGGHVAFEHCAKFCYGITINLSAHNYLPVFCAAKYLGMTEDVENRNFVAKLEFFFSSCILQGWKDPIVTLHNTRKAYNWSGSLAIVRRCIEAIIDKILTPPAKVAWSYTYTRPGYSKKRHPKDWWTEDVSFLDIDVFRCIIASLNSTNSIEQKLIGEALHVYTCRWLPDNIITESDPNNECSTSASESPDTKKKLLETIVCLIPVDRGSVSIKFLLRLLRFANFLDVSSSTKAELLRLCGLQLDEADSSDLLALDIDSVKKVFESFTRQWRNGVEALRSITKVGKLIDCYLQVVAKDADVLVQKVVSLAETVPGVARTAHDDLYVAIDIYLKEHPELSKTDKKQLCRVLDSRKLTPEMRAHAVKNEHLPLRTVIQLLFFEQEKSNSSTEKKQMPQLKRSQTTGGKLELRPEPSFKIGEDVGPTTEKGKEIRSSSREKALVRRNQEKSQR
ncbi:phototropic-responsive NPH3 family protein [Striga asiatica]|uniref:Phototropic-responsive NPH3 family protein n=1 Tax=Striga asiatica TaxID=4170 RepID=A0A5A7R5X0_STRAF|nr:phototropic-responsive NPH3 family protein [Striga asiatica]